jgi:hypothetical protein
MIEYLLYLLMPYKVIQLIHLYFINNSIKIAFKSKNREAFLSAVEKHLFFRASSLFSLDEKLYVESILPNFFLRKTKILFHFLLLSFVILW